MNNIKKHLKRIKNLEYWVLFVAIILGFFARIYKIESPIADWHSFRQADTASVSRLYSENGISLLYPKYHDVSTTQSGLSNLEGYRFVEFPLYNAVHAQLFNSFPIFTIEIWGRMLSIFISLASSIFIFQIVKRYIGVNGGLIASFVFLLLPFNIYFSRVILPEPLAVMLGLLAIWLFIKYEDGGGTLFLVFSALTFSLSLLVKPYMVFYSVPMIFLIFGKRGIKGTLLEKKYWMFALAVTAPLLLWRFWINQYPEGIPFWKWVFNDDGIRFKPAFWKWIFGERLTKLILGYWGLIPFVFGLLKLRKNQVVIWGLLIGAFLYVSVIATANARHDYYQTLVIPAISIAVVLGIIDMWNDKTYGNLKIRFLLLFSLFMMFVASFSEIKEFYKINHPEIIEAGNATSKIVPKDALVVAPYYGDTAFLYQTKRRGWPVVDRPINELIDKGAEYFVSVDLNHYQTLEFEKEFVTIVKTDNYIILDLTQKII
ncbi:MAG: glycosyltransferase family 39 protein [Candidatus Thermoplasmatota archaeon]|nr:glycosyltransferase family 39 protein [Candidatus Thermoplasmatota archaeon]